MKLRKLEEAYNQIEKINTQKKEINNQSERAPNEINKFIYIKATR